MFLYRRFKEFEIVKYLEPAKELISPERCTLEVSFDDTEAYNQMLATTIVEEYYRFRNQVFISDRCLFVRKIETILLFQGISIFMSSGKQLC